MKSGRAVKIRLEGIDCPELGQVRVFRSLKYAASWG
jgi:endonuclease YncB( thermonuclease family)